MNWFLRMVLWARNPPSPARVKLVLGVIAIVIAIALVERFIGWPDALSLDPARRRLLGP